MLNFGGVHGSNGQKWILLGGPKMTPKKKTGMMAGWCSPHLFSMRFVGELYTLQKKKGNERQEPEIDGFRNFGGPVLLTTRIVWCLCLFWRVVHTYYVQSPLLKGVAKNHICSPAKPSSWSEVPSKGMLYILSQYNLDGKRFILQLKKVCFDMMCDDVEMQHNLLECTTLTFYFCIFYDSTGWNLLIKHSLF